MNVFYFAMAITNLKFSKIITKQNTKLITKYFYISAISTPTYSIEAKLLWGFFFNIMFPALFLIFTCIL